MIRSLAKAGGHLIEAAEAASVWVGKGLRAKPSAADPQRILVMGFAALGDMLFFLPALDGLRRRYPRARLTFVTSPYPLTDELLPATGLIDDLWLFDWERSTGAEFRAFNRRLRTGGFGLAVLSLATPAHLFLPGLRAIPLRAGHCRRLSQWGPWPSRLKRALITGELARRALLDRAAWVGPGAEHSLARNLKLLAVLGIPVPRELRPSIPLSAAHRAAAAKLLEPAGGVALVGMHLGPLASPYFKMWPPERFGALAVLLKQRWKCEVVLVGGPQEADAEAKAMAAAGGNVLSLVGRCSAMTSLAAIARCRLFVSSDTGPAKAAMALGVPTATLWGPSDVAEFGAAWEPEKHLDIRTGIACSPCSRMGMPDSWALNYAVCGHHDCLAKLGVEQAAARITAKYDALFV